MTWRDVSMMGLRGAARTSRSYKPPVPLSPRSLLFHQTDIEDIRPPLFYLHSWFWWWIALGVAGTIALIVLLWWRLRPQRLLSPKSAYELALEKLEKARTLLREDDPMPYAVLVSETIRSYLGQRFQTPSTRRTTEEFLRQMEADRATPLAEHRDLLRDFLQSCDMVKFARYQPTLHELEEVQDSAPSLLSRPRNRPPPQPTRRAVATENRRPWNRSFTSRIRGSCPSCFCCRCWLICADIGAGRRPSNIRA